RPEHYGNQIDYFNLMQVFLPKGITITQTDNIQDPNIVTTEKLTDIITQTVTRYDTSERFQFTYNVPPVIEPYGPYKRYRLLLQKQSGTVGDVVKVQVFLPAGSRLISNSPDPVASYALDKQVLEFRIKLTTDQTVEIIYK